VPVVFVDRPCPGLEADNVLVDNREAARDATAHLIAHGHRRIAFVGTGMERYPLQQRLAGYEEALEAAGVAFDRRLVIVDSRSGPIVEPALKLADPATAVFSSNAVSSLHTVRELHLLGRTDLAFVSFDDFSMADSLTPPITVARQDPGLMGRTATDLLLRRIRGDESPAHHVRLPTTFIVRGSGELAPPAAPRPPARPRRPGTRSPSQAN
jgi:LacI family transcriptional regulator